MPFVTDGLEIGDFYAMGAWMRYELGRYGSAMQIVDEGEPIVALRGVSTQIHLLSWKIATLHRLGRWDEALEGFERLRDLLDDRRDRPPYFATHAFGAAGQIHTSRGDLVESDRIVHVLRPLMSNASARLYPWLLRLLVVRGDVAEASAMRRSVAWLVHGGDAYEAESELVHATGDTEQTVALVADMRRHAEATGASSLVPFADRLEGRAASAAGDAASAVTLFERARTAFDELGCPWERALTELDLGSALRESGRADDATAALVNSRTTFEELRAVRDLEIARTLLAD